MNISGYGVAYSASVYGTQSVSQASKAFSIPILGEDIAIADNKPDANKSRDFTITYYDPFKDITETGNVKLPEWMQTETKPKRSDEEILKEMEELAREHAITGEFQDSDPRFRKLMDEYISSVSPDRESILKDSTSEIKDRIAMEMQGIYEMIDSKDEEKDKEKEPIDYLIEALKNKGNVKDIISSNIATRGNNIASQLGGASNIIATRSDGYYTAVDIDRGGGKITTLVYDNQGNVQPQMTLKSDMYNAGVMKGVVECADFYDGNGEKIMNYSNNNEDGLIQLHTNAEYARRKEIQGVYNAVYDFANGRHTEFSNFVGSLDKNSSYSSSLDVHKEAYNRTYERLKNEIA